MTVARARLTVARPAEAVRPACGPRLRRLHLPRGQALVEEYLPLVDRLVGRTMARVGRWVEPDELRSAGRLGLVEVRVRSMLAMYYADEQSLREIGGRFGVGESRVCQILKGSLRQLRERLG